MFGLGKKDHLKVFDFDFSLWGTFLDRTFFFKQK